MSDEAQPKVVQEWMPVRRYVVRGRVQGVGFRWWTQREACARQLVGSVCNRADGAVEIIVGGSSFQLDEFADRLDTGPPGARVQSIEVETVVSDSFPVRDSFEIVRAP